MRYRPFKPRDLKAPLEGLWLKDRKLDGHRVIIDNGVAYSARPSTVTGDYEPHRWQPKERFNGVLDGELWWPGHTATDVAHAISACPEVLRYDPFDVLWDGVVDLTTQPQLERRRSLLRFGLSDLFDDRVEEFDPNGLLEAARLGYEGWVYKHPSRPFEWWKWKRLHTVDLAVLGVMRGRAGKYQDMVGALIVGYKQGDRWYEVAQVSGMTDEERSYCTERLRPYLPDELGERNVCSEPLCPEAVEVMYQAVTSGHRLQHPRFIRWRPDKGAHECQLAPGA